jgi:hypothetical protein
MSRACVSGCVVCGPPQNNFSALLISRAVGEIGEPNNAMVNIVVFRLIRLLVVSNNSCDSYFFRSPTPRHISKREQLRDLILIRFIIFKHVLEMNIAESSFTLC